jgi:hypothetical protein
MDLLKLKAILGPEEKKLARRLEMKLKQQREKARLWKHEKMGFLELKAILGPKEKKLARRLKIKLKKQREKQMKARL